MKTPVKITIDRAEGPHGLCTKSVHTADSPDELFSLANRQFAIHAETAPEHGGYDKCDFSVEFDDGQDYSGRYDLKYHDIAYANLGRHIKLFVEWHAGLCPNPHCGMEKYQQFLKTEHVAKLVDDFKKFLEDYYIPTEPRKGLLVSFYRDARPGDCTRISASGAPSADVSDIGLNGVSSRFKDAILIGGSLPEIFTPDVDTPALILDERPCGTNGHLPRIRAIPADIACTTKGNIGFGGNFVWTCDSRFRHINEHPIPVHDRLEVARN